MLEAAHAPALADVEGVKRQWQQVFDVQGLGFRVKGLGFVVGGKVKNIETTSLLRIPSLGAKHQSGICLGRRGAFLATFRIANILATSQEMEP